MTLLDVVLFVHIPLAASSLLLGPAVMAVRKAPGTHTRVGFLYVCAVTSACVLAIVLALADLQRLWMFLVLAVTALVLALLGYATARQPRRGDRPTWLPNHAGALAGSYVVMLTAFILEGWISRFDVFPPLWLALAPAVIGSAAILWVRREIKAGRRPRT